MTLVAVLGSLVANADPGPHVESDAGAAADLVDSLETSVALMRSLSPFDVVGELSDIRVFEAGADGDVAMKFRLQLDRERETAIYAAERHDHGRFMINALVIAEKKIKKFPIVPENRGGAILDFEEALLESGALLPDFFPVIRFPYYDDGKKELAVLSSAILSKTSTVKRESEGSDVRYSVRVDASNGGFDLREWVFSKEKAVPIKYSVSRAIGDYPLVKYFTQSITWGEKDGHDVPSHISVEGLAVRPEAKGGTYERGDAVKTLNLKWLRVRRAGSNKIPELRSPSDVSNFIEEGPH
ncbi:hypothetical protein [Rubripirellula amarantea]|uniref:hypothetical protein n=1 Tax=Rubripirellula amarantea TaxID=2527999 RepID=UPI0011B681D4|nr:hypothetical protein [Rubripirellula amarantea]